MKRTTLRTIFTGPKKVMTAAATLLFSLAFLLAPQAAAANPYCPSMYICLYDGISYDGSVQSMPAQPYGCHNVPYAWANNMATSVKNRSNYGVYMYDGANCTGDYIYIPSNYDYYDLWHYDFDNRISSIFT
jgi:hypothetical protein